MSTPPGETDLARLLGASTATVREGSYAVARTDEPVPVGGGVDALVVEAEGVTVVARLEVAEARGWEIAFVGRWVTLDVHSSLAAVGLTAAVAAAFAEQGIPCNVLAGYFHDHLLVPPDRLDDALAAIDRLRTGRGAPSPPQGRRGV